LAFFTACGDIHGHRANARVRHQTARAEHLTETANQGHHVRGGDAAIEIDLAAWTDLDQVFSAHHIGAGFRASSAFSPRREHADTYRLAGSVGQLHDPAHHLVGVTRIDTQVHRNLDGLVELRRGAFSLTRRTASSIV
jgi:hypothetical protein